MGQPPAVSPLQSVVELLSILPLTPLALSAREFSDVIVFRSPPLAVQRAIFGTLAPVARWRGYRATYPQLSRVMLAPRA